MIWLVSLVLATFGGIGFAFEGHFGFAVATDMLILQLGFCTEALVAALRSRSSDGGVR